MRKIEKLALKEAEKLRESGELKYVTSELIPQGYKSSIDFYLQERAEQLMTDIVGVPTNKNEEYNFYRTNRAQIIRMPIPNQEWIKKEDKKAA